MEEKDIESYGKKFHIKEVLAIDFDKIDFTNKLESVKRLVQLSTGMSDGQYNDLTLKERTALISEINNLNGFNDFQQVQKK